MGEEQVVIRRGFTLVEALVAAAVISILFFVLINLYPSSLMSLRKGHDLISATNLAQQILDQQRDLRFDQLVDGTRSLPDQAVDGTVFHPQLTVASPYPTVRDVSVTLTWSTSQAVANAPPGSLTLQTSLYDFQNP